MFLIEYNCKNESQKRVNIITYMEKHKSGHFYK